MDYKELNKAITENFIQKKTDELLNIWKKNDRDEYSDQAFEAIENILLSRGVELPKQKIELSEPKIESTKQKVEQETKSVSSTNFCNYCSKEIDTNAVKCPHCGEWIPEIRKTRKNFYISLGFVIFTCIIFISRLKYFVSGLITREIVWRLVFEDPINVILIIVFIISFILSIAYEKDLKKRKCD